MSSGFETRYSIEELMEKNKPIPPPKMENHPTEKEWGQMMALQIQATRLLARLAKQVEEYPVPPSLYGVNEHLTAMEGELKALRRTVEKLKLAGRKKERYFSLPKVSLPRPSLAWLWIIPILVALYALWPLWAMIWNVASALLQSCP